MKLENIVGNYRKLPLNIPQASYNINSTIIDDNGGGDYTWAQAVLEPWCSGSGSIGDPYVIANQKFTARYDADGLTIRDSTVAYFRIENITATNATSAYKAGIRLEHVSRGIIKNITLIGNAYGMFLDYADGNEIYNSSINYNLGSGIYTSNSDGNQIYENNISCNGYNPPLSSYDSGVYLFRSSDNQIYDNLIENNTDTGIYGQMFSQRNIVRNNNIFRNKEGGINIYQTGENWTIYQNIIAYHESPSIFAIKLSNGDGANISSNIISWNTGSSITTYIIDISNGATTSDNVLVYNNTIEHNGGGGAIRNLGGINCNIINNTISYNDHSGLIIRGNNNHVQNNTIYSSTSHGIYVYMGSENLELIDNEIYNSLGSGIYFYGSYNLFFNSLIQNNLIYQNHGYGIYLEKAKATEILGNFIDNNELHGIRINGNVNFTTIKHNTISHHNSESAISVSTNNLNVTIENNTINANNYGINIVDLSYSNITNNSLSFNSYGIYISGNSHNNSIIENNITYSTNYGINFAGISSYNYIYYNNFSYNGQSSLSSGFNYFNTSLMGNYWSNYNDPDGGADWDDDGIGDYPFAIGSSYDYLPIWDDGPNIAPIVNNPPNDLTISPITQGNELTWDIVDPNARNAYFDIFINSTYNATLSSTWSNGVPITINLDNLWGIYHDILIVAHDGFGESVYDQVWVTRNFIPQFQPPTPNNVYFENGTIGNSFWFKIIDYETTSGDYWILKNGSSYISAQTWMNNTDIEVDLDSLKYGYHNITIFIEDGVNVTSYFIRVSAYNNPTYISRPERTVIYTEGTTGNNITWNLFDNYTNTTIFTIFRNETEVPGNISLPWASGVPFDTNIDGLDVGNYNYSIIATDGTGGVYFDQLLVIVNTNSTFISPTTSNKYYNFSLGVRNFDIIIHDPDIDETDAVFTVYQNSEILASYENILWESDIPANIDLSSLSFGTYNISIIATDGLSSNVSIQFCIYIFNDPIYISRPDRIIVYTENTAENIITWELFDDYLIDTRFTIYRNETEVPGNISLPWFSGVPFDINIDGLDVGNYNYSIIATDGTGGVYFDQILIIVNTNSSFILPNTNDMYFDYTLGNRDFDIIIHDPDINGSEAVFTVFQNSIIHATYENIIWHSDIPTNVDLSSLTPGTYNITIQATDGLSSNINIQFWLYIYNNPIHTSRPSDVEYIFENTWGNEITWTLTDTITTNPTYTVYRNSTPLVGYISQTWVTDTPIHIDIDDLNVGFYNYTIKAYDGFGGHYEDEILLIVNNDDMHFNIFDVDHIVVEEGEDNYLHFNISDYFTSDRKYSVYNNESGLVIDQSWENENQYSINLYTLIAGYHNITLIIDDGFNGIIRNEIWVSVFDPIGYYSKPPSDIDLQLGSSDNYLVYNLSDDNVPYPKYDVYVNSIKMKENLPWEAEINIEIFLDSIISTFILMDYNVTTIFYDGIGALFEDEVWIHIVPPVGEPSIEVISPLSNDIYNASIPKFEVTITDVDLNYTWYTLNGGDKYFFDENGTLNGWLALPNGTISLIFYANDSLGGIAFKVITIYKDIIAPQLKLINPIENDIFGVNSPAFTIFINESNFKTSWYTLDNGETNTTFFGSNGIIEQVEWAKYNNGTVTIHFYIEDKAGNINQTFITLRKDILEIPIIEINSITINQLFGNKPPFLDLDVNDDNNIDKIWFTLNDGNPIYITENQYIDHNVWNLLPNGTITINIYANDSLGNIASNTIYLQRDVIAPQIIINSPNNLSKIGTISPELNLTIIDANIQKAWYTLDNGITNYTIIDSISKINQTLWDLIPNDELISINIYAIDTLGNLRSVQLIIAKNIENDPNNIGRNPIGLAEIIMIIVGSAAAVTIGLIIYSRIKNKTDIDGEAEKMNREIDLIPKHKNEKLPQLKNTLPTNITITKKKKEKETIQVKKELTSEEKEELRKTEEETIVTKDTKVCIVCKKLVKGASYVCPECDTMYCLKCAIALNKSNDMCWNCHADIIGFDTD